MTAARTLLKSCLLPAALLLIAVTITATQAHGVLRFLCLPVLVLTPGAALVALLFGEPKRPLGGEGATVADRGTDPAVRRPLTVLFGMLVCLFVALALHSVGITLTAVISAVGVGAVALLMTIERQRRRASMDDNDANHVWAPGAAPARIARYLRTAGAVFCSVVVLAVAVLVGCAIQPRQTERYTSLGFVDSKPFAATGNEVHARAQVRLNWVLRGFGCTPAPDLTSVALSVDGVARDDVAVDVNTASDIAGGSDTVTGAVTFPAPAAPGRHVVQLTVRPASEDGAPLPEPGFLTTALEVQG